MNNLIRLSVYLFAVMAIFFVSNFLNNNIALAANKVNINTADATELDTIPEVGPSTATKIIAYRLASGPFLVIEDIMKVSGIKEATFAKMKAYITVDTNPVAVDPNNDVGTTTATSTSSDEPVSTSNSSTVVSVHYIQEDLSDYVEPTNIFEVSAGRERVAYVGSPVSFEAKYKTSTDLSGKTPNCLWSFGDGSSFNNDKVTHTYRYAGEYNVVLNATLQGNNSISRTKVKVLMPNVSISTVADGGVEIHNKGNTEINLYGWKISSANQVYKFPLDTIISGGKKVIFPAEYIKIVTAGNEITLADASGQKISQANLTSLFLNNEKVVTVAELEKFTTEYKKLTRPVVNTPMSASVVSVIISTTTDEEINEPPVKIAETPDRGFWSNIFHPIRTIKETFYQ